jgi:hypothetical protein
MFDIAGPGDFSLANCGEIKIIKHTDPRGIDQDFSFTSDITGAEVSCSQDAVTTPPTPGNSKAAFTLNDVGNTTTDSDANTQDCTNIPAGTYHVTEGADPTGFEFDSLSCTTGGSQDATVPKQANITIAAGDTVTCTYVNTQLESTLSTNQRFIPQDTATVGGTGLTNDGTVDFVLYPSLDCTGTAVYTENDVALDATTNQASTSNSGDPATNNGYSIDQGALADGTAQDFSWQVTYSGDSSGPDVTSCVENSTVSITDDGEVSSNDTP